MGGRAPAVVACDTHLAKRSADDGIMDGRQLILMRGGFQLMRRIRQSGEVHLIARKAQAAAAVIRNLCPADAGAVAAFLRNKIMGDVVFGGAVIF